MIEKYIDKLIEYALEKKLIEKEDETLCRNRVLEILGCDEFCEYEKDDEKLELHQILDAICDFAVQKGIIMDTVTFRDLFDTKIMGALTPMSSTVIRRFNELYKEDPQAATDYFYDFSKNTNYIRVDRIKKDMRWQSESKYGVIDISVNLSKPEKDPRDIAAAKTAVQSGYPKCHLCLEAEGYAGRVNYPARQNHRTIPITIGGNPWRMQYSPYVYYNEHCIAFNEEHTPMAITHNTFEKLLDFVSVFPHYFIGSNADLPIVGGSILSHDHFQGGRYDFAMAKANVKIPLVFEGFENVKAGIVKWPMSVIRLTSKDRASLSALACKILDAWRTYTDEAAFVYAYTDGEPHNTITPIARRRGEEYELDLVLRNNITTKECPMGLYHPHAEYHHIKKENIGLIEVMGLAVLPARLKGEIELIKKYILNGCLDEDEKGIESHLEWIGEFMERYDQINEENIDDIIKAEIGKVFEGVLECAGVFKDELDGDAFFVTFANTVGGKCPKI